MGMVISVINRVLFFAYTVMDSIFQACGLSWIAVVCFLVVISTILRLFAANLVGTALNVHASRQEASAAQHIEAKKARQAKGVASSSARSVTRWNKGVSSSEFKFSHNTSAKDHFVNRSRKD